MYISPVFSCRVTYTLATKVACVRMCMFYLLAYVSVTVILCGMCACAFRTCMHMYEGVRTCVLVRTFCTYVHLCVCAL